VEKFDILSLHPFSSSSNNNNRNLQNVIPSRLSESQSSNNRLPSASTPSYSDTINKDLRQVPSGGLSSNFNLKPTFQNSISNSNIPIVTRKSTVKFPPSSATKKGEYKP
jgi:hypothetical protein